MVHELKTWTAFYGEVVRKRKTFEVRKNDRHYRVGDTLILQEYFPHSEKYSGASLKVPITHILEGGQFGIEHGYCVIGFDPNDIIILS